MLFKFVCMYVQTFIYLFCFHFQKDVQNSEVQKFVFNDEILALYKLVISSPHKSKKSDQHIYSSSHDSSVQFAEASDKNIANSITNEELSKNNEDNKRNGQNLCKKFDLEGCILVQKDSVWECRLR